MAGWPVIQVGLAITSRALAGVGVVGVRMGGGDVEEGSLLIRF